MLAHYTITTGHLRESPRSEVTLDLRLLADQLTPGVHAMPGLAGYTVCCTVERTTLAATVYRGVAPLVTALVCVDEDGLTAALRSTGARPPTPLWLPACLVQVHETILMGGDAVSFLGDWDVALPGHGSRRAGSPCVLSRHGYQ